MAINRIKAEDEFVVEQKTNWGEGCLKCLGVCCADFENVYYLKAGKETKPFITIKEESSCCSRMMCSPNHEMDLEWKPTAGGDNIVRMHKPFKCCCPAVCPCFQKEVEVFRGSKVIGKVKQPCFAGGFRPRLDIIEPNDEGDEKSMGHISGPCCCIGACCSSEWNFYDRNGKEHLSFKRGGMADIGIMKSLGTNSDSYFVKFEDKTIDLDERIVMLASVIFIDYLFFEGETNCICNWCEYTPPFLICPPELWCKLCDWYVCGSTIPCKLKCCISEATEAAMKAQSGGIL